MKVSCKDLQASVVSSLVAFPAYNALCKERSGRDRIIHKLAYGFNMAITVPVCAALETIGRVALAIITSPLLLGKFVGGKWGRKACAFSLKMIGSVPYNAQLICAFVTLFMLPPKTGRHDAGPSVAAEFEKWKIVEIAMALGKKS